MPVAGLAQVFGWFSLSALHTHLAGLFVVANGFAFAASGWLYARGACTSDAPAGFWRGFFLGAERNPALFGVDLKLFSYRPSLIGLALFNASFAVVQYETYGRLSLAMVLYQIFTFVYVFSYFQFEEGMTHTWDLVSERFGWMLVWGDYVLVPFFYCLPGWWLVHAPEPLPPAGAVALVLLFAFGFWLFRGANEQKHRFKRDPNAPNLGKTRPVPGRAPADFRLLGNRTSSQLYRRNTRLPRVHADDRLCLVGALPVARVAGGSAGAPLQTR